MAPKAGPSRPASTSTIAQAGPSTLPPPPPPQMAAFSKDNALYASARPAIGVAEKLAVWDVVNDRLRWEIDVSHSKAVTWASLPESDSSAPEPSAKKQRRRKTGTSVLAVVLLAGDVVTYYSADDGRELHSVNVPAGSKAFAAAKRNLVVVGEGMLHGIDPSGNVHSSALPAAVADASAVTLLSTGQTDNLSFVVGSLSLALVDYTFATHKLTVSTPVPVSTSPVSVISVVSEGVIAVSSPDDRAASLFQITNGQLKLVHRLSPPTVSSVHSIFPSTNAVTLVSQSGETFFFTLPSTFSSTKPTTDSAPQGAKVVIGKSDGNARVAAVASLRDGRRVAAVLVGAGRVSWVTLESGKAITRVEAATLGSMDVGESVTTQRFSGAQSAPAHATETAEDAAKDAALPTDVHLADLSLGERLLALPAVEEDAPASADEAVTANSLTRLLVQGLHTNDPAQIAMVLSQRDPTLIRNTIRGMPISMALPLLRACVERLGKGRGGQAQQQARGTVEWVKAVLVERGAVLLTIPSLAMHLSSLNALLESRLRLHAPLLALNGRLDLALAQIEMRRLALERAKAAPAAKGKATRYVEGESEDEMEVFGQDEGEIEDIGLGDGVSSAEESDEDDEEDLDEDDDEDEDELESDSEDDSGSEGNAFIDNEAEDSDGEEEEDSDEMEE